jgi:hypothetical protein
LKTATHFSTDPGEVFMNNNESSFCYVLAGFESPGALIHAAEKLRDNAYKDYDCHSPFPIHGMDDAMGLKRSPLGFIVFAVAFAGVCGMIALTWWVSTTAYAHVISGKPLFSYPAFIPPIFAIGVLSGGATALIGMLFLNRIPRPYHPLFAAKCFPRITDDGFFVSIKINPSDMDSTKSFLASIGGKDFETVKDE